MLNVTIQNDGKIKIQKDAFESAGCICRITNDF